MPTRPQNGPSRARSAAGWPSVPLSWLGGFTGDPRAFREVDAGPSVERPMWAAVLGRRTRSCHLGRELRARKDKPPTGGRIPKTSFCAGLSRFSGLGWKCRPSDPRPSLPWRLGPRVCPGRGSDGPELHGTKPAPARRPLLGEELIEAPPSFPGPRDQRDVAGRHYLTKAEINARSFATHPMKRPRGWDSPFPESRYWGPQSSAARKPPAGDRGSA
jgi:hypothetical protein